ncbi:MAG: flavin-containing monooxygenase [Gaiellaceae bacterium]
MSIGKEAFSRGHSGDVEVAIIGAGQAGLAMGHFLARQGRQSVILERAVEIASAWRERWDSLTLFTPRRYSALPGLPFEGDPDGYPSRDEVIAYLERYAEIFELPVELDSVVERLERGRDGRFQLGVDGRTITSDQVVVATGPFQTPYVPKLAEKLSGDVFQTHAVGYRRPSDVPQGTVLVVGGGNTGFQIAKELSATHKVVLSIGSRQKPLPQRLLGRDLFWWLSKARILDKTAESRLGRKLSTRDTLIGSSPRELTKRYGVELKPRLVDVDGRRARIEDGSELDADAVIWATGYRPDYSCIKLPIFEADGRLRHRRGVTDTPGLYFLGLTWQHTRGSALIGFVKDDAEFIAERIAEHEQSKAPAQTGTPVGAGTATQVRSTERS